MGADEEGEAFRALGILEVVVGLGVKGATRGVFEGGVIGVGGVGGGGTGWDTGGEGGGLEGREELGLKRGLNCELNTSY